MSVTVAKTAGFCFGVNRAVEQVFSLARQGKPTYTLGPIIHNPQIIGELERLGIRSIDTPAENTDRRLVVIRSHGVGRQVYEELQAMGVEYVDATCPFVAKIHRLVEEHSKQGKLIIIAGDPDHPEVVGIQGHCYGPCIVAKNAEILEKMLRETANITDFSAILVSQTTFNTNEWQKCVEITKKVCTNLAIFDTICIATMQRQKEAAQLAQQVDAMIVVGGRNSSNTAKLVEICTPYCPTYQVEQAQELLQLPLQGKHRFGVTAGASTPGCIIKEVRKTMTEIQNMNDEMSFEEMLEQSFKSTYNGEKVTGVVTGITGNEVAVDIGTKHAGYIPLHELTDDPNAKIEDLVKKGDELELMVVRVNDVEGTVMLSKKRLDAIAGFEKVMGAEETGEILEGVVTEIVKGGLLAMTNGVKVFIPASQATASRHDNIEDLLKKTVRFKIIETNRQRRRALGSIRAVLKEEKKALEEKFWSEVEVGKVYTGVVKSLTSYGAFVDLGGVDGMVHISELSWSRIKHPSEVVNVGDTVEVYVKDIDTENKKISLGYKKAEDNPWTILQNKYHVGDVVPVKVVSMTAFGAFAQVIPGVDGLIHISQISQERINKPQDVLSIGQEVNVKITELDFDKKRVSLSIRALLDDADRADESAEADAE